MYYFINYLRDLFDLALTQSTNVPLMVSVPPANAQHTKFLTSSFVHGYHLVNRLVHTVTHQRYLIRAKHHSSSARVIFATTQTMCKQSRTMMTSDFPLAYKSLANLGIWPRIELREVLDANTLTDVIKDPSRFCVSHVG